VSGCGETACVALFLRGYGSNALPKECAFEQHITDHQPVIGKSCNQSLAAVLCRWSGKRPLRCKL